MLLALAVLLASADAPRDLTAAETAAIKTVVEDKLKDPESARFKWEKWNGGIYYCGMVNAKNSYGGYVGFVPFIAVVAFANDRVLTKPFVILADDDSAGISDFVVSQCIKAGYSMP